MRRSLVIALAAIVLLSACGSDGRSEIVVLAAADLQLAFEEVGAAYEEVCECRVTVSYGSSGRFTTQIQEGLRADAFFSADVAYVEQLSQRGLLDGTERVYALGLIVLAVPASTGPPPGDMRDLLDPAIRRISIANPEHAPYGVAARAAMQSAGIWDGTQPKLVLGENAAQATQFVESGDVDAGIVPLALAIGRDRLEYEAVDLELYEPLVQAAAVLASASEPALASGFIDFVISDEGQEIMSRYGFIPPPPPGGPRS